MTMNRTPRKELSINHSTQRKVIHAAEILIKLKYNLLINYTNVTIMGNLDLDGFDFPTTSVERNFRDTSGASRYVKIIKSKIKIVNSEIHGVVNLSNVLFEHDVEFVGTEFKGNVSFIGSIFKDIASFHGSHFKGFVNFASANSKHVDFWGAVFHRRITLEDCIFGDDAYFLGAKFHDYAHFNRAIFEGQASFESTKFFKVAEFKSCRYYGVSDFSGARFYDDARFEKSIFFSEVDFAYSRFYENTNFDHSKFNGPCYFSENTDDAGAKFYGSASFHSCEFDEYTRFLYAKFYSVGEVYFPGIRFCSKLNEKESAQRDSKKISGFIASRFNNRVDFRSARFEVDVYFERAYFMKDTDFKSSIFYGIAGFFRANFLGDVVSFEKAFFNKEADFIGTSFSNYANFNNAIFVEEANFSETFFRGDALFDKAHFDGDFNLIGTKISFLRLSDIALSNRSRIFLMNSTFNQIDISWPLIKDRLYRNKYEDYAKYYDDGVYKSLIQNYEKYGNFEEADECNAQYKRDRYKRLMRQYNILGKMLVLFKKLLDSLFFGYGASLKYPIIIISSAIIIYLYFFIQELSITPGQNWPKDITANFLGWFIVPIFIVVLAKKIIR